MLAPSSPYPWSVGKSGYIQQTVTSIRLTSIIHRWNSMLPRTILISTLEFEVTHLERVFILSNANVLHYPKVLLFFFFPKPVHPVLKIHFEFLKSNSKRVRSTLSKNSTGTSIREKVTCSAFERVFGSLFNAILIRACRVERTIIGFESYISNRKNIRERFYFCTNVQFQ